MRRDNHNLAFDMNAMIALSPIIWTEVVVLSYYMVVYRR